MSAFWKTWLKLWCGSVLAFGVALLFGGLPATAAPTMRLLDLLNGPAPLELTPPLYFASGVLGGVTIGWAVGTYGAILVAIDLGDRGGSLWRWMARGVAAWFVTDSTLSIASGFGLNVIPNVVLLTGFFLPLYATGVLRR